MKRIAIGAVLVPCLLGWTPTAVAQGIPDCTPAQTAGVTLESQEKGLDAPLIATHEVTVRAELTANAVDVLMRPPAGVRVLFPRSSGESVVFIVPIAASVPITLTWRQATDPSASNSDPDDPTASCTGSRVVSLDILPARRSSAVKTSGFFRESSTFAVVPALKRPDLSPLEITARITSRARLPSPKAKAHRMVVPMRNADQIKYSTRLPNLSHLPLAKKCRLYLLTCGSVFSEVARLFLDADALGRGIEKGDLNGAVALLARTQPSLEAARYGIIVGAIPAPARLGAPRAFGYDLQVRQGGRLVGRVRKAGRCWQVRDSRGLFTDCRITRSSFQH